ncbi:MULTISPECIES: DnaB-like helicase C-terminal domain-containing protein [unclassified Kitasatospora]|uniref:DnaB-like helicase C-terminal domain-containing protein n=1 Tax=unclassified Kitasatospora TaxID=2633591 RepID=UPI00340AE124
MRRLKSQGRLPAVLLVDPLQSMTPETGRATGRTTEVDELARGLKILAKAFDIPMVVAARLNRCVEQRADKKPAMADLRESGGIEANANAIILLHQEDAYAKASPRAGEADLIVAKNRMGRHIHGGGRVPGPLLAFRRHHPQRHMTSPGPGFCGRIPRRTADPGSLAGFGRSATWLVPGVPGMTRL